ncbi:Hsp20/alpha crystallin family protein [Candidatus Nitrotoga sp. M5]|uniref:Hsp20/alpha crystallin family protein n=1 Tax=Candidatus Nitrotoga sp. M5 TaxID=2890409 RepID=UPI001EF46E05|nr:Hsp20/alpha crystallin family protein [Candidatus Nitrotoga sp. M5]CAH1387995.1 HSP20 family protein [Candidatus Nitrotoga sp. M5]
MLDSLKQAGRNIGHGLSRTWESLAEGWRELFGRCNEALTHFSRSEDKEQETGTPLSTLPHWSLLAGEVEETDKEIVVHLEIPGMEKEDFRITIENNMLYISGEKHFERDRIDSVYHTMERAYGAFQRTIPLPRNVDTDKSEASYKNGVMTIRLPKVGVEKVKNITLA